MKFLSLIVLLSLVSCARFTPHSATSNAIGSKKGASCSNYVLGFHTGGKSHIQSAAKKARISKVATVDQKTSGLFPIYWKECTYVSGQ